ncbi:MAG: glycosyltransferase WbsX family protein [Anaerolineae bacterium]
MTAQGIQVAAYYFPQYHPDPRNDAWHGQGWSEWELVRRAEPRFPGHQQPRVPLWGYEDESLPEVMARKIDAAADHGLDAWIWDWYWYEDGPFLQRALEEGFLKARNADRLRFALMWANHDWLDIHPAKRSSPPHLLAPGSVSLAAFETATEHMLRTYLGHPSYWRLEGGLYFSVYEIVRLIRGLGGLEATRGALDGFRARTRAAGLGDLHLNAVVWGLQVLPGELPITDANALLGALGLDSVTSYVWVHHQRMDGFPTTDYRAYAERCLQDWPALAARYALPYFPNVTMGWDSSPRTVASDVFGDTGYPFTSVLANNTPDAFRAALLAARAHLLAQNGPRVLTLNAWNEWTEGSYLEPDTVHGLAYLEAIRDVFVSATA